MKSHSYIFSGILLLLVFLHVQVSVAQPAAIPSDIPTPESFFGFKPGDDRMLFDYEDMIAYLTLLDRASPRVSMQQIAHTEMGKPMYLLFVSSEENISRLERLREINRQLAMEPTLPEDALDALVAEGKVFFLMTLSMHSTEVAPSQAAPVIVHELITSDDARTRFILENTVYMITPSHNPDGMNMVVEHYLRYKGSRYEGSSMPGVYHKYAGHNINRDFLSLNLSENRAVSKIVSKDWFPQLSVEKHQMGSRGPRYYVSPPSDPLSENILPGIWNWKRIFGSRALTDMTAAGLKGVSVNYLFDMYWPGSTATALWKGVVAMLSEAASVDVASPVYVEPNELSVSGKGLAEYEISINMPDPWPGGWWHLGDIVEYERVNTLSYLYTAAMFREEILRSRNDITRKEVARGKSEAPFYYILPLDQHDQGELADLVNLLDSHGVSSYELKGDWLTDRQTFNTGDIVVPLSQPFRAFIKEVMEKQKYPVRHYSAGGEMIRPYDITSWSLPLHKGVQAIEINSGPDLPDSLLKRLAIPFRIGVLNAGDYLGALFSANHNESYKAAFMAIDMGIKVERLRESYQYNGKAFPEGSFYIPKDKRLDDLLDMLMVQPVMVHDAFNAKAEPVRLPRIAIVESWFHDMDAGWTRFIFDSNRIPYKILRPVDLQDLDLKRDFDLIIMPDQSQTVLMAGKMGSLEDYSISRYHPDFARGMEQKGFNRLLLFVEEGGLLLSWGRSTELFMGNLSIEDDKGSKQEFSLPITNIGGNLRSQGLDVTGSLLRVKLRQGHPLTLGLPEEIGVFHRGNPVFATSIPYFDMDRRVIATFAREQLLISGFIENEKLLYDQAAMVWVKKGKGQMVLFSFCPQFRGSTPVTYKLLYNALLLNQ